MGVGFYPGLCSSKECCPTGAPNIGQLGPTKACKEECFTTLSTLLKTPGIDEKWLMKQLNLCYTVPDAYANKDDPAVADRFCKRLMKDIEKLCRLPSGKALLVSVFQKANEAEINIAFLPGSETAADTMEIVNGQVVILINVNYAASSSGPLDDEKEIEDEPLSPDQPEFLYAALDLDTNKIVSYRSPTFITLGHEMERALEQIEALLFLREGKLDPNSIKPSSDAFKAAVLEYHRAEGKMDYFEEDGFVTAQFLRLYASRKLAEAASFDTMPPKAIPHPAPTETMPSPAPTTPGLCQLLLNPGLFRV